MLNNVASNVGIAVAAVVARAEVVHVGVPKLSKHRTASFVKKCFSSTALRKSLRADAGSASVP
jgi:hypothetical protein